LCLGVGGGVGGFGRRGGGGGGVAFKFVSNFFHVVDAIAGYSA